MNIPKVKKQNKPNLLIYAHYYYPDVASTGQLLKELAEGMLDQFCITVICVVPSYDGTVEAKYKVKKYYYDNISGVNIIRVRVPDFDKTKKISRVKNILAYFLRALWATGKLKNIDYVYSISQPPILGGLIGVLGKWTKHARYIYNIQDFNPEQTIATGYSKNKAIIYLMMAIDKFSCKRANNIIVVGRDMVETLKNRFNNKKTLNYAFVNNWVDEKEIYPLELKDARVTAFKDMYGLRDKFVFMYSGNLGLYYDLENLIRVMAKFPPGTKALDGREVVFAFIGAGSIKEKLVLYKQENQLDNVIFIPYQDKEDLNFSLNAADVQLCVNAKGIKGVSVPSKLYGCLAVSKPVFGVLEKGSEARLIMEDTQCGLVCEPGDYEHIERHIKWFINQAGTNKLILMGYRGHEYLVKNLTKEVSVKKYADEILKSSA